LKNRYLHVTIYTYKKDSGTLGTGRIFEIYRLSEKAQNGSFEKPPMIIQNIPLFLTKRRPGDSMQEYRKNEKLNGQKRNF